MAGEHSGSAKAPIWFWKSPWLTGACYGAGRGGADIGNVAVECNDCLGAGTRFECPKWESSLGHCCPAGTHSVGCRGRSTVCETCRGSGQLAERFDSTASPANLTRYRSSLRPNARPSHELKRSRKLISVLSGRNYGHLEAVWLLAVPLSIVMTVFLAALVLG